MLVSLVAWLGGASVVVGFNETLTGPFLSIFFWAPLAMLLLWPAIIGGAGVNPEQPGAAEPA